MLNRLLRLSKALPLFLLLTLALPSRGAEPGLQLDEFLFPLPDQRAANLALLAPRVEKGASVREQALYGIQLLAGGDLVGARRHCQEALTRGRLFEPVYCMSLVSFKEGKLPVAQDLAQQAIALRPDSVAAYIVLANVERSLENREGMVHAMEMGMAAMPHRADFWEWELARMFEELGDLDAALQCVGVLMRIAPQDPKVFAQAGDWLRRKKRLPEAAQMYRFALSKVSWYQPAALALLDTLREDGRWSAIPHTAEKLLDNPQLEPIHKTVAAFRDEAYAQLLKERLGTLESRDNVTFSDLRSFDRIEPGRAAEVLMDGAAAMHSFGQAERAVALLRKADSLTPGNGELMLLEAQVLLKLGRTDEAAAKAAAAAELEPGAESALVGAQVALRTGDAKGCRQWTELAISYRPDHTDALVVGARCHRLDRRSDAEEKLLLQAYKVEPENASVLTELARYYLHLGKDKDQAARYLAQLYSLAPEQFRVCRKLAELQEEVGLASEALATEALCYTHVPPHEVELRTRVYENVVRLAEAERSEKRAEEAYRAVCEAGLEAACVAAEQFRSQERQARRLRATPYRLRRTHKPRVGELERLGNGGEDFLVLGLEAPGFDQLTREERLFLFFMSRAAIAGNDLLYVQNHRHAFAIKQLFETLFRYRSALPKEAVDGVHDYLKYLWVNHGNYEHRSGIKFVPRQLDFVTLKQCMESLAARGVDFDFLPGKDLAEKLAYLQRPIFDAGYEPALTVTEKGRDVVAESAVNHYDPGLTDALIEGLDPALRDALNVRFSLVGGEVRARSYRVGDLGSLYLENVVYFLEQALPYAQGDEQRQSLEALIEFYRTADEEAFRRHSIAWLKTRGHTDYINGFVEQLKDPRGVIGNFEGMAAFVSDAQLVDRLAEEAAWFEKAMPWPDEYKREKVNRPVSNVATVLVGTGDMGPVPWAGYNLPNYADIRADAGSKNVIFLNIMSARSDKEADLVVKEFYLPQYQAVVRRHGELANNWIVYMHEIIGHGSGKPDPALKGDPRTLIGRSFSAIEEARADLVALYFMPDAKLVEMGAFPKREHEDIVLAAYAKYFQGFLTLYRRFHGETIMEAHWKGRQLILNYLVEGGEDGKGDFGLGIVNHEGKVYVEVRDPARIRAGLGQLLERIQVIKSTADRAGAEALIDRFGTRFDPRYREDMVRRSTRLGLSKQTAFVYPRLVPVRDRKGEVVDAKLVNDEDLTAQQLRYSRLQQGRELE